MKKEGGGEGVKEGKDTTNTNNDDFFEENFDYLNFDFIGSNTNDSSQIDPSSLPSPQNKKRKEREEEEGRGGGGGGGMGEEKSFFMQDKQKNDKNNSQLNTTDHTLHPQQQNKNIIQLKNSIDKLFSFLLSHSHLNHYFTLLLLSVSFFILSYF